MSNYIKAINGNKISNIWIIDSSGIPIRLDSKNLPAKALYWFLEGSSRWIKFLDGEYIKPKSNVTKRRKRQSAFGKSSSNMNMNIPTKNISIYDEEKYVK